MPSAEITIALISLGGVVLSVGISLIIGIISNRYNYRQLYAQTVSSNRMEWINAWRENVSRFLACAEMLHKHAHINEREKIEKEMYEARGMVVSRLNLDEDDHKAMLVLVNGFSTDCCCQDFVDQREAILAQARKILKPEWERVKAEARGMKYAKKG